MFERKGLKEQLFKFYNTCKDYFIFASEGNKVPSEEKKRILQFIPENSKVLDVACGTAENAELITKKSFYYGIDISNISINFAKQKYLYNNKVFLQIGDAENLPYPDNLFDIVLSTYSLEHFTNPKRVIDEMLRVCKPKGKVILISPAWDNPFWVPPSLSESLKNPYRRIIFILSQIIKLLLLSFGIKKQFFDIIKDPVVLHAGYRMDNDAVYIVRVREIINYLLLKNTTIIYLRKTSGFLLSLEKPYHGNLKKNILIFSASLLNIFYRYLNSGLFIVAEKK